MRRQTNLKIRFLTLVVTLLFTYLHIAHAEEVSAVAPETNDQPASIQKQSSLQFEQTLKNAPNVKTDALTPQKYDLRIKLRMSRSIHNFDALNKVLEQASSSPKLTEAQIAEKQTLLIKQSDEADQATQASGGIVIEGDRMINYLGRSMASLGNASLKKEKQTILGDRIEFDTLNRMMHASGNVSIETPDSIAKGPELHLNIDDSVGNMRNASFTLFQPLNIKPITTLGSGNQAPTSGYDTPIDPLVAMVEKEKSSALGKRNAMGEAKKPTSRGDAGMIFFEGEGKKRLSKARFTSCEAGSDDWYMKAEQIKLDDDSKSATATNGRIEFKGVPILYSPKMSFPYGNQRKSGFLSPIWGQTTKSGFELFTPYYINIAPNMDATVATRLLSKRGIQLEGEFRYLDENYSGLDLVQYLPSDSLTNQDRYFVSLKHQHNFGSGWTGGYMLEKVSDDQYFSEIGLGKGLGTGGGVVRTSRVNLPQQFNINYSDDVWQFSTLVQKYQTLENPDYPIVRPYQRLPQITLNGTKDWDMLTGKIQNQLVRFDLDSDIASNKDRATGTRFSTYPSISMPVTTSYGFITPKIGLNYASYNLNNTGGFDSNANRSIPTFSLDSGLFFERETRIVSRHYTQTLEPRLYYVYIPYRDQSQTPVFDTGLSDLNMGTLFTENQFSGGDRVNNANQVSFALSSRMIDAASGQQRLAVSVGQRFYFEDQKVALANESLRTGVRSDIITSATARLTNKWDIDAAWQYNTYTSSTYRANIGARYKPEPGKTLNLTYRYRDNIDPALKIEQINVSTQWPLGKGWYGLGRWNYSLKDNKPIEGLAGLEYDAGCWQSRFVIQQITTATAQSNYGFFYQLELGGMASVGANPFRLLTRSIPGYMSSSQLPDDNRQDYNE